MIRGVREIRLPDAIARAFYDSHRKALMKISIDYASRKLAGLRLSGQLGSFSFPPAELGVETSCEALTCTHPITHEPNFWPGQRVLETLGINLLFHGLEIPLPELHLIDVPCSVGCVMTITNAELHKDPPCFPPQSSRHGSHLPTVPNRSP